MISIITLNSLSKKYGNKEILNKVNYKFEDSGFYTILGESGIGKTTLFNIIAKLDTLYDGEVLFNGKDINSIIDYWQNSISIIFQEFNLIPELNVYENLLLVSNNDNLINEYLSKFDLLKYKNKNVKDLSGGEIQRVAIIRALLKDTPVIICDEPTGNLDDENCEIVFSILKEISKEKLVIVITHNDSLARKYAHILLRLKNKNINEEILNKHTKAKKVAVEKKEVKLNYKLINKIGLNINTKGFLRPFTFLLLQIIFIVITFSSLVFIFYNHETDFLKTNEKYGIKYARIESKNDINIDGLNLYNISYYPVLIKNQDEMEVVRRIYYNNSISDEGIIITDFLYDYLKINNIIEINDITFNILDVINTGYIVNNEFQYDIELFNELLPWKYAYIMMSENNFKHLILNSENTVNMFTNNYKKEVFLKNISEYNGIMLEANDIILPIYFNYNNKYHVGDNINIEISSDEMNKGEELEFSLTIKGFTPDQTAFINFEKNKNVLSFFKEKDVFLYEIDSNYKTLAKKYRIDNIVSIYIESNKELVRTVVKLLIPFSLILFIALTFSTINYISHIISKSRKNIYILYSLGFNEKKIKKQFTYFIYILYVMAFGLSIFILELLSFNFNKIKKKYLSTYWFQKNYLYYLVILIISIFTITMTIQLSFKKDEKKTLSQRIKTN